VTGGKKFDRTLSGEFCIDPSIEEHYQRMLGYFLVHTGCPENIVHCWSVTTDASTEELQNLGLFSLIALAKAIGSHRINTPINITVLANGLHEVLGDEDLVPIKNTLLGPIKIIPREYPNVFCRSIDLALTGHEAMSTEGLDAALRIICDDQTNPILALRGTTFWRQTFLPIHLPRSDRSPLPKNGVYLVIGGLGAIGLNLARSLANASASCLVLTSRTPFPPTSEWDGYLSAHPETDEVSRKIKKLKNILAKGVNIILRSVDVTSRKDMSSLVKEIRERYGALHGVIHAAGVPDTGGIIQLRSREDTAQALRAKINGLLVLDQVLGDEPLDLLVLCSSIGAILYHLKFGEVGYVVASDFVNAFARSFARRRRTLTVAINWTDWKEGGMWSDAQKRLQQKYESFPNASRDTEAELGSATSFISDLLLGISDAEASEVFERALTQTSPELIVSTQNLSELLARHASFTSKSHESFLENVQLVKPAHERSTLSTPYVAPRTKTERHLAEIWQELLGIARVGIDDDFFDLGGDSLLAIRVLNRLHEDFQIDQTLASLLELPTVQKLAAHVDEFTSKRVMKARPAASGTTEEVLI
jgi:NAD(P)-dependent dehydrogenase (short-subunit alcohol dehydrogenase family)/acyl carrier protein